MMTNDNYALFAETITRVQAVSRQGIDRLFGISRVEQLPKSTLFIRENKPDHYEYLLLEGIVQCGSLGGSRDPVTYMFYLPLQVLLPRLARINAGVSTLSAETLTACTIAKIPAADYRDFQNSSLEIKEFSYKVLEYELLKRLERERVLLTQSAQERLNGFRREFPELENLVPHPAIASYLGITPVSLSRLRRTKRPNRPAE